MTVQVELEEALIVPKYGQLEIAGQSQIAIADLDLEDGGALQGRQRKIFDQKSLKAQRQ